MTDTTETPSGAPTDDTRTRNKKLIFAALEEAGITKVSIEFDGVYRCGLRRNQFELGRAARDSVRLEVRLLVTQAEISSPHSSRINGEDGAFSFPRPIAALRAASSPG